MFIAGALSKWLPRNKMVASWKGKVVAFVYFGLGIHMALQHQK
jgi:cadmium resistance protein CadD (predicted permease)